MPAADEQQLISQAKGGNSDALRLIVERYMKQAYNIAYSFMKNHDDAEDIAQDALVRAYRSLNSFRGDSEFSTWLYRIILNLSLTRLKQKKTKATCELSQIEPNNNLSDDNPNYFSQIDISMHIEKALQQLPTLQRAVVILRHLEGLTTRQVSSILHCSEGTVKTHLFRGLKKLRAMLRFLKEENV